ncbi:MAG: discoidin domain-containing protein [Pirellulales bacterium]
MRTKVAATWLIALAMAAAGQFSLDGVCRAAVTADAAAILTPQNTSASSADASFPATGAVDGDRFSVAPGHLWRGADGEKSWTWQADFGKSTKLGAILQVLGDDESILAAAPLAYVWQVSDDGTNWRDVPSTSVANEQRMFRLHRLPEAVEARYVRLSISSTGGKPPAIREVEFFARPDQTIEFPDWVFAVGSEDTPQVDTCHRYLDLAHQCKGWEHLPGQYVWHGYFGPEVALVEPKPMCVFYTGNHRDWCEIDPTVWRGTQELLKNGSLPMWAACGGCQAFGLLEENGCDVKWDCPNCRDPQHPKSPIYGHIGLVDPNVKTACGIYTNNIYERGPTPVRRVADDPVLRGLPDEFLVPEYHCGQLEYLPDGWDLIATRGKGGKTWMQCMRKRGTCIYAAQFHIELQGTPEVSQQIMSNFLAYAKGWKSPNESSASAGSPSARHVAASTSADATDTTGR